MDREPLDSVEYESTYLELRPLRERLSGMTDAAALTARLAAAGLDAVTVASNGLGAPGTKISVEALRPVSIPVTRPALAPPATDGRCAAALHSRAAALPKSPRVASEGYSHMPSRHLIPPRRRRPFPRFPCGLAVVSASLGVVADLDMPAARVLFVALTGALITSWARIAWHERARAGPFDLVVTRAMDRLVTAAGTFFAIALWARYAPDASAALSRAVVVVLCGLGAIAGLLAAAGTLLRLGVSRPG